MAGTQVLGSTSMHRPDAADDNPFYLDELRTIVGRRYVLTSPASTRPYRTGFRFGTGPAFAVVRPGNLVGQWRVLKACAAAKKIIIMQAANTGLTGGSTPDGSDYDREIVIPVIPAIDSIPATAEPLNPFIGTKALHHNYR
jgi:D-lactate dehydrogenase